MKTRRITLFGLPFDTVSEEQALLKLHYFSQLPAGNPQICVTPNPEMIVEATKNKEFYGILQKSDFALADGIGIVWASGFLPLSKMDLPFFFHKKLQLRNLFGGIGSLLKFFFARKNFHTEIQTRVTGTDVFGHFLATSQAKVFLLGGKLGAAEKLAGDFKNIVGFYDSAVTLESTPEIVAQIISSSAQVLFVALGAPKQELWIAENMRSIPELRFAMGVGGAFDFLTGVQKRAPKIMQTLGLEWLYRLILDPRRIKRIWNATVRFFLLAVREKSA